MKKRILVLCGGISKERLISLDTGKQVANELKKNKYRVITSEPDHTLLKNIKLFKPDIIFNALHGQFGEDGYIQTILETQKIPYTHSGVYSSALAMDKEKTKDVYRAAGLPVAASMLVSKSEILNSHPMPAPYVVKPYNEGSSVGVYIVNTGDKPISTIKEELPDILMVEEFIPGYELTVTVLDGNALTVTNIITDGWYDFNAKYENGGSHHEIPANLPKEIFDACIEPTNASFSSTTATFPCSVRIASATVSIIAFFETFNGPKSDV